MGKKKEDRKTKGADLSIEKKARLYDSLLGPRAGFFHKDILAPLLYRLKIYEKSRDWSLGNDGQRKARTDIQSAIELLENVVLDVDLTASSAFVSFLDTQRRQPKHKFAFAQGMK